MLLLDPLLLLMLPLLLGVAAAYDNITPYMLLYGLLWPILQPLINRSSSPLPSRHLWLKVGGYIILSALLVYSITAQLQDKKLLFLLLHVTCLFTLFLVAVARRVQEKKVKNLWEKHLQAFQRLFRGGYSTAFATLLMLAYIVELLIENDLEIQVLMTMALFYFLSMASIIVSNTTTKSELPFSYYILPIVLSYACIMMLPIFYFSGQNSIASAEIWFISSTGLYILTFGLLWLALRWKSHLQQKAYNLHDIATLIKYYIPDIQKETKSPAPSVSQLSFIHESRLETAIADIDRNNLVIHLRQRLLLVIVLLLLTFSFAYLSFSLRVENKELMIFSIDGTDTITDSSYVFRNAQNNIKLLGNFLDESRSDQLGNLTLLDLNYNQLRSLPPEIFALKGLIALDLGQNELTSIPAKIGELQNLNRLYLNANSLSNLPRAIWELKSLRVLNISKNKLDSLPVEIGALGNLYELDLSNNYLSKLTPEIGKLIKLRRLDLGGNALLTLTPEIGELKNLDWLNLYGNSLSDLPPEIGKLENLTSLYLSDNSLSTLPPEIGKLERLKLLDIRRNNISSEEKAKIRKWLPDCDIRFE